MSVVKEAVIGLGERALLTPQKELLRRFPGIGNGFVLSEQTVKHMTIRVCGDSIMYPYGVRGNGYKTFSDILAGAVTASGIGQWQSYTHAVPGADNEEIMEQLENPETKKEIIQDRGNVLVFLGANGNRFRRMIKTEQDFATMRSLADNPFQREAAGKLKEFFEIKADFGRTFSHMLRAIHKMSEDRLQRGNSQIMLFIELPYDYGEASAIHCVPPNSANFQETHDINLKDYLYGKKFGYAPTVAMIKQIGRRVSRFKASPSKLLLATLSTFGLEKHCTQDEHLDQSGHYELAKRTAERIAIMDKSGTIRKLSSLPKIQEVFVNSV